MRSWRESIFKGSTVVYDRMEGDYHPTFSCPFGLMGLELVERIGKMEGGGGGGADSHLPCCHRLPIMTFIGSENTRL